MNYKINSISFVGTMFDSIVAFGGGSSIDAAKFLMLASLLIFMSHLRLLINSSFHITAKTKELFTVPATSGTGSEVTTRLSGS